MAQNSFGWFGWLSLAGFVILGALYVLDLTNDALWDFSATWTLVVAILAGLGAAALYFGNDPTDSRRRERRREEA